MTRKLRTSTPADSDPAVAGWTRTEAITREVTSVSMMMATIVTGELVGTKTAIGVSRAAITAEAEVPTEAAAAVDPVAQIWTTGKPFLVQKAWDVTTNMTTRGIPTVKSSAQKDGGKEDAIAKAKAAVEADLKKESGEGKKRPRDDDGEAETEREAKKADLKPEVEASS